MDCCGPLNGALVVRDGRHVAQILEEGTTVIVQRAEVGRLVQVLCNDGATAVMLAQELAAHADRISE